MKNFHRPHHLVRTKQRGVALIVSLIILLFMTIVGLSIMNGNRYFEKNAGNTRDKQRALQAAQDALLYGEWWLTYGGGNLDFQPTCSASTGTLQVCETDPGTTINAATLPWNTSYMPALMQVQTAGNATVGGLADTSSATSDVKYAQPPGIYINCINCGNTVGTTGLTLYRITAIGYGGVGGTNGTVAIVQSVYASAPAAQPLPQNLTPTY